MFTFWTGLVFRVVFFSAVYIHWERLSNICNTTYIQRRSVSWGVKVLGLLCSQDIHCSDIGTLRFNRVLGACFMCQISCIVSCCCLAAQGNGWLSGLHQYNQWPGRKWQMILIKKDNAPVYRVFTVLWVDYVVVTTWDTHWSMCIHVIVTFLMHVSCILMLFLLHPTNAQIYITCQTSTQALYVQPHKHTACTRYCNVTHTFSDDQIIF
jgi:hypothetical protein